MTTGDDATRGMVLLDGGSFVMGSDRFYPEERPLRQVSVRRILDRRVSRYRRGLSAVVEATGHVTIAEVAPRIEAIRMLIRHCWCLVRWSSI